MNPIYFPGLSGKISRLAMQLRRSQAEFAHLAAARMRRRKLGVAASNPSSPAAQRVEL